MYCDSLAQIAGFPYIFKTASCTSHYVNNIFYITGHRLVNSKQCTTIKLKGAAFYKVSAQPAFFPVAFPYFGVNGFGIKAGFGEQFVKFFG